MYLKIAHAWFWVSEPAYFVQWRFLTDTIFPTVISKNQTLILSTFIFI